VSRIAAMRTAERPNSATQRDRIASSRLANWAVLAALRSSRLEIFNGGGIAFSGEPPRPPPGTGADVGAPGAAGAALPATDGIRTTAISVKENRWSVARTVRWRQNYPIFRNCEPWPLSSTKLPGLLLSSLCPDRRGEATSCAPAAGPDTPRPPAFDGYSCTRRTGEFTT
jgi:hypothetical protein